MKQIDRIRNMNAEELAEFICELSNYGEYTCDNCMYYHKFLMSEHKYNNCQNRCQKGVKVWLKSEVEE